MKTQIEKAKKTLRELKKVSPYIFLEYSELKTAKYEYQLAKERLDQAKNAWKKLGEN